MNIKIFILVTLLAVFAATSIGCQVDCDLGMYRCPRFSTKALYKGQDETINHSRSRDSGTFGTGNSFGMTESPTDNRRS